MAAPHSVVNSLDESELSLRCTGTTRTCGERALKAAPNSIRLDTEFTKRPRVYDPRGRACLSTTSRVPAARQVAYSKCLAAGQWRATMQAKLPVQIGRKPPRPSRKLLGGSIDCCPPVSSSQKSARQCCGNQKHILTEIQHKHSNSPGSSRQQMLPPVGTPHQPNNAFPDAYVGQSDCSEAHNLKHAPPRVRYHLPHSFLFLLGQLQVATTILHKALQLQF